MFSREFALSIQVPVISLSHGCVGASVKLTLDDIWGKEQLTARWRVSEAGLERWALVQSSSSCQATYSPARSMSKPSKSRAYQHRPEHCMQQWFSLSDLGMEEIIYQGSNSLPKKSIQVAGAKVHRIIANVCSFEWAARRADVRLTALPEPSPIFTAKDLGVRMINVSMHDDLSCWLSTQAMAFGEPIAMNLVINANLDARGIIYNAKLVDFPDAEKTSEKSRTMFAERMSSLFE